MSSAFPSAFPHALTGYGWDEDRQNEFTRHRDAGLIPARIVAVDRGQADVITEHGPLRADTTAVASPDDPAQAPCTGDWAGLRPGDQPAIVELLPRRTAIVRSSVSRRAQGQVLAANVDTVAIVVSLEIAVDLGRIERQLALAWESGARPVVVLTKADQVADPGIVETETAEVADAAPGVDVIAVSATTGEGLEAATAVLTGTVVLIGTSGAGKSTLGNALLGDERLATGAVRAQDGKGRHTTVRRELLALPGGGVLIDTPGLRGVGLWDAAEGLQHTFAEIQELAQECRFGDCVHETEPGCAVLAAIEDGTLPRRRLDSYRKLRRENEWIAARTDARLRAERAGRWKTIAKAQRQAYKLRGGRDR
ncbi:ribosome small subunit-dependent GTPase A [Actinomadura barringtoniae]|uniref:ribosome small subunit-dependent GTPase A n=1 Tax=Actinomadura barringtoniae TaxID=1427535 RepID=UPI001FB6B336|nr:ribosome small subunit-dependent GTPase A [Actinomadura barringtoniae]